MAKEKWKLDCTRKHDIEVDESKSRNGWNHYIVRSVKQGISGIRISKIPEGSDKHFELEIKAQPNKCLAFITALQEYYTVVSDKI